MEYHGVDERPYKIILCGKKGVGKTTLLRLFNEPCDDYGERSSDMLKSVRMHRNTTTTLSKVTMKVVNQDSKPIKAEVWDTGNLEAHGGTNTLTRSYFRDAHAAILVYVPGNEESKFELQEWIKQVLDHSPQCVLSLWCNNRSCEFGTGNQTRDIISLLTQKYSIDQQHQITYTEGDIHGAQANLRKLVIDLNNSLRSTPTRTTAKNNPGTNSIRLDNNESSSWSSKLGCAVFSSTPCKSNT